jgi:hypothetical protein
VQNGGFQRRRWTDFPWFSHRLRSVSPVNKTFGTRYGMKHGIVSAQHLLGHADIRATQLYLAEAGIPRAAVEEIFSDVVRRKA